VRPSGQRLQRKIGNALSKAEHFASDSGSTREDAHKLLTFSNLKTERVIPIGLNYPYAPLAEDEARGRLAPTMPPPGPFFLAVGSSAWYKNRPVLLRAFARARELRPEMRPLSLVFVGSSLPQELLDLARELDLGESIVEAGARSTESLHAFYALATALVFPSRWEGFGWPPIEAQATGCPVIASNAGPLGENLGDSALTAEPDDVEAFAWHMIQLLEQPETCLKLREAGLKNAQRFSTEAMTEGYLAAYEEILSHA